MALWPLSAHAQIMTHAVPQPDSTVSDAEADAFLNGATPVDAGLELILPALGDNPAAVPVQVRVTEPITEDSWCEEIILLAERNPIPVASHFRFTKASGAAEVAVRVRLIESMKLRALARMNDGRFLQASAEITVAAGGCGM